MSLRRSTRTAGKPPRFADSAYSYDASAMARKPSASAAKRAKAAPSAAVAVAPSARTIARFAGTPTIASALVASAMRLNIGPCDAGKVQALALSNLFNERYDSTTKASDIRSAVIGTMRRKRLASASTAAASGAGGGSSSSSSGGGRVAKRAATSSSSSSSSSASAAKRAKAAPSAAVAPSARTIAPCNDELSAQSRVAPLRAAFVLQEEGEQEDELVLLQTRAADDVLTQRFAAAYAAGLVFDLTNDADSLWLAQIPPQPNVLAQQQSKGRSRAARNPARSASSGGNRSGGPAAVVKTERIAAAAARGGS